MTRARLILAAFVVAALLGRVGTDSAGGEGPATQQALQQRLLARKEALRKTIKELLQRGGFVDKSVAFKDVTGDKRDDAVVRVNSGGANGAVAIYVFDRQQEGRQLEAIFRSQKLMRASTRVRKGVAHHPDRTLRAGRRAALPRRGLPPS